MKKRLFVLWTVLLVGVVSLMAQDVLGGLAQAFQKGDSQALGQYMHEDVSLALVGKGAEVESRPQVEIAMRTFFASNKAKEFDINHKGKRDESAFIVGTLRTSTGSYRVNCYLKKIGEIYLIHRSRIEKTND